MGANVLIAVPTFESIEPAVFKAIFDLQVPVEVGNVDFDFVKGYDCARARNAIAQKAVDLGYDYVLMIDSDTVVPSHALVDFFEHDSGGVILGVYPRKDNSRKVEAFSFAHADYTEENQYGIDDINEMRKASDIHRIAVKGGGLGCAFISVDILKEIEKPWFVYVTYPDGNTLSEDLYFCEQVNKRHRIIQVDTRVLCGHVTKYTKYE